MITKKRGLSDVVATVLLLLLTISVVIIVAQFIIPFTKKNLAKSTECIQYRGYFSFQESFESLDGNKVSYNCFDGTKYGISVRAFSVENATSDNIAGFDLVFESGGESESVHVRDGTDVSNSSGGIRMLKTNDLKIKIPKLGEVRTFVYMPSTPHSTQIFNKAKIYPVLKSGAICEIGDTIKFESCNAGVSLG